MRIIHWSYITLLSLALLCMMVQCGEDYYQLLGVSRNANEQQIKRAFKKLALKYHPDKNKDNKEHAQKMFQKIANAYETLMDKEKREVYDRRGEDGVRDFEQQKGQPGGGFGGGMNFNFDDVFSQFFGQRQGGGGHQQFHFNFGQQQQREPEVEKFFEQSDVYEINLSTLSKFLRRTEVWMILFYKPQDQDCKKLKDVWRELAEKYYGIFKVAAVNCQTDEELCQDEFQVYENPTIMAFQAKINSEGKKFPKNKPTILDKLAGFAISHMENFVNFITTNTYDDFVSREFEKNKLLLFTEKKSTPPLFKALSKDLKGKLVFGEIRKDEKELINKFQVTKFPTLMIVTDPANYKGEVYVGDYKKDQIMKFLREYAYTSSRARRTKEKSGEIQYLDQQLAKRFCNANDPNFCFIMVLKKDTKYNKNLEILGQLAKIYSSDPIGFYYVDTENINYTNVFPTISNPPIVIAMKGKRKKYSLFEGEIQQDDMQNLKIFIDSILGGSQLQHKLNGDLEKNLNVKVEL